MARHSRRADPGYRKTARVPDRSPTRQPVLLDNSDRTCDSETLFDLERGATHQETQCDSFNIHVGGSRRAGAPVGGWCRGRAPCDVGRSRRRQRAPHQRRERADGHGVRPRGGSRWPEPSLGDGVAPRRSHADHRTTGAAAPGEGRKAPTDSDRGSAARSRRASGRSARRRGRSGFRGERAHLPELRPRYGGGQSPPGAAGKACGQHTDGREGHLRVQS
jgi:hypothetical protein